MKRKVITALLAATMVASLAVGCGNKGGDSKSDSSKSSSSDEITIGFSQVGAESDWRTANSESMKSTFSEKNGYKLIFDDAQQKQENQITAIRNVSDDSLYTAWVGSNFKMEGQKACEWLNAYAEAKGMKEVNIAHIQGTIGASAQIGRTEGLEEAAKEYGWNIVAQQTGEFTQAKGQEVMESMLKQHDNINVVYCENDNEAFGAIDAIEAAGKTVGPDGDILVMSFDTTNAGLTDTLSGKIICDTECNPLHGPRVEEIIKKLEDGKDVDKKAYVEEEMFAYDDTVKSVKVDDKDYDVTKITQEILDKRAY